MKLNILDNLKLWQKLGLLLLLAVLMTAFPFYQFFFAQQTKVDFALREITGIEPARMLARVAQNMADHRYQAELAAAGDVTAAAELKVKATRVDQSIRLADEKIAVFGYDSVNKAWGKIKQDWAKISGVAPVAGVAYEAHTDAIDQVLDAIKLVADESYLTFDPDAHTYYLYSNGVVLLPQSYEYLARARDYGAARLVQAEAKRLELDALKTDMATAEWLGAAERAQVQGSLEFSKIFSEQVSAAYIKAIAAMPRLQDRLAADIKAGADAAVRLPKVTTAEFVKNPRPSMKPAEFFASYSQGLGSLAKLTDATYDALRDELVVVADGHRQKQLQISALVALFTLLGGLAAYFIVRNITGTVTQLQHSVDRVRGGDLTALSAVASKDEVGDLGRTVNQLLQDRVLALQTAEGENDQLNESVIKLLGTMARLSQRDLTVRATVTADVIGTLGDSINELTDATTAVLRDVSRIAGVVAQSSRQVKVQSDAVATQADQDRSTAGRLVANLQTATTSMRDVAALAENSNIAAAEASRSTENAMTTVQSTVRSMDAIRETISEMEKRIKRLGERSQEISQIVGLINTISERTHMLSLNASMQAAMAGDAGRGFAVVAEEVQRLAENSRQATAQIASLAQNIQTETNDTIATVNKTIGQVVEGSEMARASGEKMNETRATTARLVQSVQTIAKSAQEQMRIAAELQMGANAITESTEKTAEQLLAQNQVTASLLVASQNLVESVSVFKLPTLSS